DLATHGMPLHLAQEGHLLVQLLVPAIGVQEPDEVGAFQVLQLLVELLGLDADRHRRALGAVEHGRNRARAPELLRRTLAALDANFACFHGDRPYTKSELIESSSCVRLIASPSREATERTRSFPRPAASAVSGIVSVTISSSSDELASREIAPPESTAWVAQ